MRVHILRIAALVFCPTSLEQWDGFPSFHTHQVPDLFTSLMP